MPKLVWIRPCQILEHQNLLTAFQFSSLSSQVSALINKLTFEVVMIARNYALDLCKNLLDSDFLCILHDKPHLITGFQNVQNSFLVELILLISRCVVKLCLLISVFPGLTCFHSPVFSPNHYVNIINLLCISSVLPGSFQLQAMGQPDGCI